MISPGKHTSAYIQTNSKQTEENYEFTSLNDRCLLGCWTNPRIILTVALVHQGIHYVPEILSYREFTFGKKLMVIMSV